MLIQHYLLFFVHSFKIIDLQCCNYRHLPSNFSTKLQSSMTIFHHKLLTREGRGLSQRMNSTSDRGDFWAQPVEILVFPSPTGYMLTSYSFPFIKLGYIR